MKKLLFLASLFGFMLSGCSSGNQIILEKMDFKDIDYGFPTKYIQLSNIEVGYIDEGKGSETIFLIHGLGSNAKGWIKTIPVLAETYRVIALDLPGYGKSSKGYYDYSMDFYAEILKRMMDELGISQAIVAGHSMGGQIAMTMALKYPQRVTRLILFAPAGFERFDEGEGAWMKKAMHPEFVRKTTVDGIDKNLRSNFYNYPADARFMIDERIAIRGAAGFKDYCYAVSRNVFAMLDGPVWMKLEKITQPTLIIFGENDLLIPNRFLHAGFTEDIARIGDEKIPNSTLKMIPQCGHFVQFEKASEVNQSVLDFLQK
jgi:pimeloyl-ACP methyl ester carboxylesterase